jgi:LPS sulfotransferase NodH
LTGTGIAGRPEEYYQQRQRTGLPRRPLEYFEGAETDEVIAILGDVTRVDDEVSDYDARRYRDYGAYLAWTLERGTTSNGVFGAKLMWGYLNGFASNLRELPGCAGLSTPELLAHAFPDLHYVVLTRDDKVGQAISLWKALQTWNWSHNDRGEAAAGELRYSFDAIDHLIENLQVQEAGWRGFFAECGIEPYVVTYELLSEDYARVIGDIIEFVGVKRRDRATEVSAPRLARQADAVSENWKARYLQEKGNNR